MLWILFVMGAIVAMVIAIIVGGLATPRHHVASRSRIVPRPPDVVWATIRDFASYSDWRIDLESAEQIDEGQAQVQWRETSTRRSVAFGVTHEDPPHRMIARILDKDLAYSGEWQWDLAAEGAGTRVTITERGEVGNPVFRFIGTHFIGHTRTIDAYLNALALKLA